MSYLSLVNGSSDVNIKPYSIVCDNITSIDTNITNLNIDNLQVNEGATFKGENYVTGSLQLSQNNNFLSVNPIGHTQVLACDPTNNNRLAWIDNGSGGAGVTSLTSGNSNIVLSPSTITSTGSISVNPNLDLLTLGVSNNANLNNVTINNLTYPTTKSQGYIYCDGSSNKIGRAHV